MDNTALKEPSSVRFANVVFEILIIIFSTWTVLAQLSLLVGFSFKILSIIFSLAMPLVFLCFTVVRNKTLPSDLPRDYPVLITLSSLCLIGAALALFSIRPNADDVDYVSRAIFYLENPSFPLDLFYHDHALTGFSFYYPLLITQIIELFWGYLAFSFGVQYLNIYHILAPIIGGLLIPLVWYLLLSKFTKDSITAILGTSMIIAFLCIDGSTTRSFGNFAFVRIWQGKVILMAILIPLFISFSLDFFRHNILWNGIKLFLLAVASTGFSSSSIFLLPSLAISMAVGFMVSKRPTLLNLKNLAIYFLALSYIGLIGFYCVSYAQKNISLQSPLNIGWPVSFTGVYKFVFGGYLTLSSFIFCCSILLCVVLLKGTSRQFVTGWLVFVLATFLNPFLSKTVAEHLTSANAYWRLIYILPYPLMVGLPIVALLHDRKPTMRFVIIFLATLATFTVLLNAIPNKMGVFNKVEFGAFRHKFPRQVELDVKRMAGLFPGGPMLAPLRYSSTIPMFTSRLPQLSVRGIELEYQAYANGQSEDVKAKRIAFDFVTKKNRDDFWAFAEVVKTPELRTVVVDTDLDGSVNIKQVLFENGFTLLDKTDTYMAFVRSELPPSMGTRAPTEDTRRDGAMR